MPLTTFTVIGGDARQLKLAELLRKDGYTVKIAAFDEMKHMEFRPVDAEMAIKEADVLVLPAPAFDKDGTLVTQCSDERISSDFILRTLRPGMIVTGGRLGKDFESKAASVGCVTVDILNREDYAIANAVPTAEGAIQVAMEEMPVTVSGSKCLVAGAGRIGKQLALRLKFLGADVTVACRKASDAAFCEAIGAGTVETSNLAAAVQKSDIIFNTIPATVFDSRVLARVPKECLCIDLASLPGGFDETAAEQYGVKMVRALSLPGQTAPLTSARNLKKVIERILVEQKDFITERVE